MSDRIDTPKVEWYMNKFGVEGLAKGGDRKLIKQQLLDSFRKETFNTAVMMIGPQVFSDGYSASEKEKKKLENIIKNVNNKWRSLCKEFAKYKETCNLIFEDDFKKYMNDRTETLQEREDTEYVDDDTVVANEVED